eukprot:633442-Rhodomonas_salina.1
MRTRKSPGVDGFTAEMLRSAPRSYLCALYRLINMYLEGKPIQLDMKGALAVLLLKKEPREELQNHSVQGFL